MKKIDTSNISGDVKAPITKRTLEFYNEAIAECAEDIIKALYGSYTTGDLVILHGCEVTANIPGTSTVTAGAIYYNGEVYRVDAASVSSPSNTLVWKFPTTLSELYDIADPVKYSDSTDYFQHFIGKVKLVNASSGSGLANYDSVTVKTLPKLYNKAEQSDVTDLQNNKADKAMTSWTNASIPSGVTGSVQYRRDSFGVVYLRGYVQLNLAGNTTPIVVVSSMGLYKPAVNMQIPVLIMEDSNSIHTAKGFLEISSTSSEIALAVDANITTSNFVRLDGVTFVDYSV